MKKIFCIACLLTLMLTLMLSATAQDNEYGTFPQEKGFKKENVFTGGNFTAGFSSGGSTVGVSPIMGYRFNKYVDGGVVVNYLYNSRKSFYSGGEKYKQHNYGAGVFARAYPVDFLFVQAQLEHNFISAKYKYNAASPYIKENTNAPSLLLGGGYTSGRIGGSNTFFFMSVMVDVLKNRNSPYVDVDNYGQPNEKVRMQPVINAGINIGLFGKRYGDYE